MEIKWKTEKLKKSIESVQKYYNRMCQSKPANNCKTMKPIVRLGGNPSLTFLGNVFKDSS